MGAFADLNKLGGNLDELEILPLVEEVLLQVSQKLAQCSIWYSQHFIIVYHEYGPLSVTEVAELHLLLMLYLLVLRTLKL